MIKGEEADKQIAVKALAERMESGNPHGFIQLNLSSRL